MCVWVFVHVRVCVFYQFISLCIQTSNHELQYIDWFAITFGVKSGSYGLFF